MDIIKKNLVLFIVIGVSLIACVILVFMVIRGHQEMSQSIAKVEEIKSKIAELGKQRPSPHPNNMVKIKKDIELYQDEVDGIVRIFGQPYRVALNTYISALDAGLNEKTFMEKFNEFWTQNAVQGSNRYMLFDKFIKEFNEFNVNKAKEIFKQVYQKNTCEKIDDGNINDIIMSSIGVPRTLSQVDFRMFLSQMQTELIKYFNTNNVLYSETVSSFSFNEFMTENANYAKEDIPLVVDNFIMLGDLIKLAVDAGVKDIQAVHHGTLSGTVDGKFTRYRFQLEVAADLDVLQKFVNAINDAYKTNKVYIVKGIELEAVTDKAKELTTQQIEFLSKKGAGNQPDGPGNEVMEPGMVPGGMMPPGAVGRGPAMRGRMAGGMSMMPENKAVKDKEEKKTNVPFYQERNYGMVLIGGDKKCRMIIDVDYVVYNRPKFIIQEQ